MIESLRLLFTPVKRPSLAGHRYRWQCEAEVQAARRKTLAHAMIAGIALLSTIHFMRKPHVYGLSAEKVKLIGSCLVAGLMSSWVSFDIKHGREWQALATASARRHPPPPSIPSVAAPEISLKCCACPLRHKSLRGLAVCYIVTWPKETLTGKPQPPIEIGDRLAAHAIGRGRDSLLALLEHGNNLSVSTLDLSPISGELTDEDLCQIVTRCPKLVRLELGHAWRLGEKSWGVILRCSSLVKLDCGSLAAVASVTSEAAVAWDQLTELHLCHCPGLSDGGLQTLCRGAPLLSFIDLSGCRLLGAAGVEALEQLHHLKGLKIEQCSREFVEACEQSDLLREALGKRAAEKAVTVAGAMKAFNLSNSADVGWDIGLSERKGVQRTLTPEVYLKLAEGSPRLKSLQLCVRKEDLSQALSLLNRKLPRLDSLTIVVVGENGRGLPIVGLNADDVQVVVETFPCLMSLTLTLQRGDANESLALIANANPFLMELDVGATYLEELTIRDETCRILGAKCPHLQRVAFWRCGLSETSLQVLKEGAPDLSFFFLKGSIPNSQQVWDPLSTLSFWEVFPRQPIFNYGGAPMGWQYMAAGLAHGVRGFRHTSPRFEVRRENWEDICRCLQGLPYMQTLTLEALDPFATTEWEPLVKEFGHKITSLRLAGDAWTLEMLERTFAGCTRLQEVNLKINIDPALFPAVGATLNAHSKSLVQLEITDTSLKAICLRYPALMVLLSDS